MLVATILGRPCTSSLPGKGSGTGKVSELTGDHPRSLAFEATYNICSFIGSYIQEVGKDASSDPDRAQSFLHSLRHWVANLPPEMRSSKDVASPIDIKERALVIGGVHNACVYYFAILLVTRPFLIFHFTSHIALEQHNNDDTSAESGSRSKIAALAEACIDSATLMIKICHDAWQSKILLANMCLLK